PGPEEAGSTRRPCQLRRRRASQNNSPPALTLESRAPVRRRSQTPAAATGRPHEARATSGSRKPVTGKAVKWQSEAPRAGRILAPGRRFSPRRPCLRPPLLAPPPSAAAGAEGVLKAQKIEEIERAGGVA